MSPQFVPSGANKFDKFFKMDASGDYSEMSSTIDPENKLYMVAYASSGSTPDRLLIYNYEIGEASLIPSESVQALGRIFSPGYTLEQIDNINASLDALTTSLDAREYRGGALFFGAVDDENKLGAFTGSNHEVTMESSERQLGAQKQEEDQISGSTGFRSFVSGVRPLVDTLDAQVRLGKRNFPSDSVTWTSAKTVNARSGVARFNAGDNPDARYHRAEIVIPSGTTWTQLQGFDIDAEVSSKI